MEHMKAEMKARMKGLQMEPMTGIHLELSSAGWREHVTVSSRGLLMVLMTDKSMERTMDSTKEKLMEPTMEPHWVLHWVQNSANQRELTME